MAYTDEYVERVLRESLCLHHNLEAKDAEIARLRERIAKLEARLRVYEAIDAGEEGS